MPLDDFLLAVAFLLLGLAWAAIGRLRRDVNILGDEVHSLNMSRNLDQENLIEINNTLVMMLTSCDRMEPVSEVPKSYRISEIERYPDADHLAN